MARPIRSYQLQVASLVVLYYDYLLTLPNEINYVWKARWRLSTLFYIFCRYSLVANLVHYFSIVRDPQIINCDKGYTICRILNLFGYIGIMAVWGLRTYAVCQRSKYILVLLGLPGAAVIILLLIQAPTSSCTGPPRFPGLRSATTGLLLFFEINAFLFATLRVWKTMRGRKYATLSTIVFSQGLTYMIPTFVLSVMSLSLNWIKFSPEFVRLTNAFKLPLAGLLTARFILKLRKWEANKGHLDSRPPVSVLRFAQDPPTLGSAAFARLSSYKAQASTRSMFDELGEDLDPR